MNLNEQLTIILENYNKNNQNKAIDDIKDCFSLGGIDSHLDLARNDRCGFPEVIYGEGKSAEQIISIIEKLQDLQVILATRVDDTKAAIIQSKLDVSYDKNAQCIYKGKNSLKLKSKVAVLSAGTSDYKVVAEACRTLNVLNCPYEEFNDCGVAALHRLNNNLPSIKKADIIIVIAGMEGALASVVAGLVDKPIIAVPTSVGYGAHFQGIAPLLGMLNSCGSGVSVVNIDNGFGAAISAFKIASLLG